MKKIFLVTGAAGLIGESWCKKLLKKGHKVYAIDINTIDKKIKNKNLIFYKDTVYNFSLLEKLIKKVDIVCHFAGIAEPLKYLTKTSKVINLTIKPTIFIVDCCTKYKKKILFTSTSEVYGNLNKNKFKETDSRLYGPTSYSRWCYATAKSLSEHYIIAQSQESNLKYLIIRLFNIYGPKLKGRVVDAFIKNALQSKNLLINGNGKQVRCFLYIDDCIDALYKLVSKNIKNEIFNVGQDKKETILDLAKRVIKLTNSKSKIIIRSNQYKKYKGYQDIIRRIPDVSKLNKKIGFKPKFSFNEGLKIMIQNIHENEK